MRCGLEFFDQPCVDLARALLGCVLVCCEGGEECRGEVVEVEAYLGGKDKAAHSYNGRRSRANEAMYMVSVLQLLLVTLSATSTGLPPGSRHGLRVLHIWHALLFQCVQSWGGGSSASAGLTPHDWPRSHEKEEREEREGRGQRNEGHRLVQWTRQTVPGHGHHQAVSVCVWGGGGGV